MVDSNMASNVDPGAFHILSILNHRSVSTTAGSDIVTVS